MAELTRNPLEARSPAAAPPAVQGLEVPAAARSPGGTRRRLSMFDRTLMWPAVVDSFGKLDPRVQWRNPVMFVVYIGSILTTVLWIQALGGRGEAPAWFILNVAIWL